MFEPKAFGKRIQQLRKESGLSQKEFAEKINVSISHVGKIEAGIASPSLDLCLVLGKYFSVSMDYLLTGSCNASNTPREIIIKAIELLSVLDQQLSSD